MKAQTQNQHSQGYTPVLFRFALFALIFSIIFFGSCSLTVAGSKAKSAVSGISRTISSLFSRVRRVPPALDSGPAATPDSPAPDAVLDEPELEAPSRGATIETPRIVMRSLVTEAAPVKKPVGDRVDLRVPNSTEAPRLPADYEIGLLGWGDADRGAYNAALTTLTKAVKTAKTEKAADPSIDEQSFRNLVALGSDPQVHIGSPLVQVEGTLSFLVRFIGKELTCAGEIHLNSADGGEWTVDALLLDLPVLKVQEGDKGELSFDPLTYKRFF